MLAGLLVQGGQRLRKRLGTFLPLGLHGCCNPCHHRCNGDYDCYYMYYPYYYYCYYYHYDYDYYHYYLDYNSCLKFMLEGVLVQGDQQRECVGTFLPWGLHGCCNPCHRITGMSITVTTFAVVVVLGSTGE